MEAAPPLKALHRKILYDFLLPIAPSRSLVKLLTASCDENLRPQDLTPLLLEDRDQMDFVFSQNFLAKRLTEWREETAGQTNRDEILVERTLALLGKAPMRNLFACSHQRYLARVFESGSAQQPAPSGGISPPRPEADSGGALQAPKQNEKPLIVQQEIPYALQAEKTCEENGLPYGAIAFLAGLHYDWLSAVIKKRKGPSEERATLEASYKSGLLIAQAAVRLGGQSKNLALGKYLFAGGLLLPLGRVLMPIFFPKEGSNPSWSSFVTDAEDSIGHRYDRYIFLERKTFGITHAELSSLLVNFGGLLSEIEKAICYYPDPWILEDCVGDHASLSMALSIAARVGTYKGAPPVPLDEWQIMPQ